MQITKIGFSPAFSSCLTERTDTIQYKKHINEDTENDFLETVTKELENVTMKLTYDSNKWLFTSPKRTIIVVYNRDANTYHNHANIIITTKTSRDDDYRNINTEETDYIKIDNKNIENVDELLKLLSKKAHGYLPGSEADALERIKEFVFGTSKTLS